MCQEPAIIAYAQCWEDADVVLSALDVQPGDACLSIASAGDNTLALLTRNPGRVVAVDLSPAQLACLELRVAAYRELDHSGLLELIGSRPSTRRETLYFRCRKHLSPTVQSFWDARLKDIRGGIGAAGKLERYFGLFRKFVLPLVHSRWRVQRLLRGGSRRQRHEYYEMTWNTWRWRLLFRMFFSRKVMTWLGRDRGKFRYADETGPGPILYRTQRAVTELDPGENPYLQWMLHGHHTTALPCALRPENFSIIRANLDRLEWHCMSLEDYLAQARPNSIDRFNLSNVFEYMPEWRYHQVLSGIVRAAVPGGRVAYWNMFVPRRRPEQMSNQLKSLRSVAKRLHQQAKSFFYRDFVLEQIIDSGHGKSTAP